MNFNQDLYDLLFSLKTNSPLYLTILPDILGFFGSMSSDTIQLSVVDLIGWEFDDAESSALFHMASGW